MKDEFMKIQNVSDWHWAKGYGGYYKVNQFGAVLSFHFSEPKLMKFTLEHGYPRYNLRVFGVYESKYAHQLVAETFIPNPDNKPEINHIDSNRMNNHVSNLEWVTRKENVRHCINAGRFVYNVQNLNWYTK